MEHHEELQHKYEELAKSMALRTWITMGDPNGITRKLYQTNIRIRFLRNKIKKLNLGEIDYAILNKLREDQEQTIELKYRPTKIYFNDKALHILTKTFIPDDIKITLSLGHKFLFPYNINDKNLHKILAQLEMAVEDSIPDIRWLEASIEIRNILREHKFIEKYEDKNWLKFIHYRANLFFKEHKDSLLCTRSDKGGHTVIMDIDDYNQKLTEHLSNDAYSAFNDNHMLETLINREIELIDKIKEGKNENKYLNEFLKKGNIPIYEPNTLNLAKFYGLPKVHKNGCPLRPITSTVGSPGYQLSKIFLLFLNEIFPPTDIHIRDTVEFIDHAKNLVIKEDDVLVSFDVVSMFTTIPVDYIINIVMSMAGEINFLFQILPSTLLDILEFLLKDCAIFQALDSTYKQIEGLPMGSCLSPAFARIFMDRAVERLLANIPTISFIKVFVDDTMVAMNNKDIPKALHVLNSFQKDKVRFTVELENDNQSINFLNTTLTRQRTRIITNWYRKPFASGRLVNYYSSHKSSTILATAAAFIRTILALSSPEHFAANRLKVIDTLRLNSFPEDIISFLVHDFYTYMKPTHKRNMNTTNNGMIRFVKETILDENVIYNPPDAIETDMTDSIESNDREYIIFPHSTCQSKLIKRTFFRLMRSHTALADSVKNTRITPITTKKTPSPPESQGNALLLSQCKCKERIAISCTRFNENVKIARSRIHTKNLTNCLKYKHAHSLDSIKTHKGLAYKRQTRYLMKYTYWHYRHALDSTNIGYQFPNHKLSQLITNCLCCKS